MTMNVLKPARLKRGDLIGLISPAGPVIHPDRVERGVRYLERQGYRVRVGRHVNRQHGYLAGTDHQRLADLHDMFAQPEVRAILCVRGGYGTSRLLPLLDYPLIRRHPKILIGFSDITALQLALWQRCRLVSFHGPMLQADLAGPIDAFAEEWFWKILTSTQSLQDCPLEGDEFHRRTRGCATGRLLGGNLSLVASLLGTPYQPSFQRALLFLEEVAEEPYRIDRLLMHLHNANVFNAIAGLLTGQFTHCVPKNPQRPSFTVEDLLAELTRKTTKPFLSNLPFGHVARKLTLPVGVRARLDAQAGRLDFMESAVR